MKPVVLDGQNWYDFREVCGMLHVPPSRARRVLPPTPLRMIPAAETKIAVIRREDVETLAIRFGARPRAEIMKEITG